MKASISTSIEQSRRLLSCGVDPKTADMSVRTIKEPYSEDMAWYTPKLLTLPYDEAKTIYGDDEITPAWSLSVIISLLPSEIDDNNEPFDVVMHKLFIYPYLQGWQIEYQYCEDDECHSLICIYDTSLIEACVQMIEWLTEHNYPLNKIEE